MEMGGEWYWARIGAGDSWKGPDFYAAPNSS